MTFGSLIVTVMLLIAFAINFVFTPAKLTPVVLKIANNSLNADLKMRSVELTFFSTFPKFGLKIEDGSLVSKTFNDSLFQKTDSLASFGKCIVTVSPFDYIFKNKVTLHNLSFDDISVYAFRDSKGKANWDIMKASKDTVSVEADSTANSFDSSIDLNRVEIKNANIIFDDRSTQIYTSLRDVNMKLGLHLDAVNSSMTLHLDNKNILFWQKGELLVNNISTSIDTKIDINSSSLKWNFNEMKMSVNGINLDVNGWMQRDTLNKTVVLDFSYGLHAPTIGTVINMIPEIYVKRGKVKASGDVKFSGTVKGKYGNGHLPEATLGLDIEDVKIHYDGFPYGINNFSTSLNAYVDLMRRKPSYVKWNIMKLKGAKTDVVSDIRIDNLLVDPVISIDTKSTVDLDALAKTIPFQEGIKIGGKLNASVMVGCTLSSIKQQDLGRIQLKGYIGLDNLQVIDTNKDFNFKGNAFFEFSDKNYLEATAGISNIVLKSKKLSYEVDNMKATVSSSNPQDTSRVVTLDGNFKMSRMKFSIADSIKFFSNDVMLTASLFPQKVNMKKPAVSMNMQSDSINLFLDKNDIILTNANIKLNADKVKDKIWRPVAKVGFDLMKFTTPSFEYPITISKSEVNVDNNDIRLDNAIVRIGNSDLKATGKISGLYAALTKKETLKGELNVSSNLIDCNQLITGVVEEKSEIKNETSHKDSATSSTANKEEESMKLFVLPENLDFKLNADFKKVIFEKMSFENVEGEILIKNQAVYMKKLKMHGLDSDMQAELIYKASNSNEGYTGFDFKISDINIGKLVNFIPSLDTIVPMLRSFKGVVQFDVAAESKLDSNMNIKIPTLRSAMHIKGDSLVLMDGETFAEISKMLMFKNKKSNVFDSISVNVMVDKGNVKVFPFQVTIDRYKAAIGGEQGLDMNFNYHISILKSPLPFKAGVNISGNLDKMKFRIGKAKYKDDVTPAAVHKVDSTRIDLGKNIVEGFNHILNKK